MNAFIVSGAASEALFNNPVSLCGERGEGEIEGEGDRHTNMKKQTDRQTET